MKNFLPFLLLSLYPIVVNAQNDQKRDNLWLFGYESNPTNLDFGGTNINFSTSPPDIYYEYRPMNFSETNASICDGQGNLLFYTNGFYVANKNHQQMENGGGLSPGGFNQEYIEIGLIMPQGAMILPVPESDSLFMLFHATFDLIKTPNTDGGNMTSYYSLIDMSENNGLGAVIEKNVVFNQDTLTYGKITAARHGNGRDWWILMNEYNTNRYYRWLLTPEGLQDMEQQAIGETVTNGLGQAVFSPDGTKYVNLNQTTFTDTGTHVAIYDFDRCTGLLSNDVHLFYQGALSGGVAISPNSRFLYVSKYDTLFQFDFYANDIASSREIVGIYDGTQSPFGSTFYLAQLAPDGKIYMNCPNGENVLHVIHNPDLKGDSCNFEQHGIDLPTYNSSSLPNFPNYRLGKLEGSPCDSIISTVVGEGNIPIPDIFAYPNPASSYLKIKWKGTGVYASGYFRLYNLIGEQVLQKEFSYVNEFQFSLEGLNPGVYIYHISIDQRLRKSGKLVIVEH